MNTCEFYKNQTKRIRSNDNDVWIEVFIFDADKWMVIGGTGVAPTLPGATMWLQALCDTETVDVVLKEYDHWKKTGESAPNPIPPPPTINRKFDPDMIKAVLDVLKI